MIVMIMIIIMIMIMITIIIMIMKIIIIIMITITIIMIIIPTWIKASGGRNISVKTTYAIIRIKAILISDNINNNHYNYNDKSKHEHVTGKTWGEGIRSLAAGVIVIESCRSVVESS